MPLMNGIEATKEIVKMLSQEKEIFTTIIGCTAY